MVFLVSFAGRNVYERALGRSVGDGQTRLPDGQGKFSEENFRGESGDISAEIKTELSFIATEESFVYELMKEMQAKGEIAFTEKNYAGLGKFIDSINGLGGNGTQTWIYYVNGKKAGVGVSNYQLKPGDVVSWKYESQY